MYLTHNICSPSTFKNMFPEPLVAPQNLFKLIPQLSEKQKLLPQLFRQPTEEDFPEESPFKGSLKDWEKFLTPKLRDTVARGGYIEVFSPIESLRVYFLCGTPYSRVSDIRLKIYRWLADYKSTPQELLHQAAEIIQDLETFDAWRNHL